MEMSILHAIQSIRCGFLDSFVLFLTKVTGSYGQIWLVVGAALCVFKKTRKSGIAVIISYALVFAVGQFGLKDLIARARPCHVDETVQLLIARPSSYSFPSTHSGWAFAGATAILLRHKKGGLAAMAAAVLIAFSRLYLFVHYPTDVLFGAALGVGAAFLAHWLVNVVCAKIESRHKA